MIISRNTIMNTMEEIVEMDFNNALGFHGIDNLEPCDRCDFNYEDTDIPSELIPDELVGADTDNLTPEQEALWLEVCAEYVSEYIDLWNDMLDEEISKTWKGRIKRDAEDDDCVEIEIYAFKDKTHRIHTDFIECVDKNLDEIPESAFHSYYVMNEEEYDNTIYANTSGADFDEWYNDKDATIMVVMLKYDWDNND